MPPKLELTSLKPVTGYKSYEFLCVRERRSGNLRLTLFSESLALRFEVSQDYLSPNRHRAQKSLNRTSCRGRSSQGYSRQPAAFTALCQNPFRPLNPKPLNPINPKPLNPKPLNPQTPKLCAKINSGLGLGSTSSSKAFQSHAHASGFRGCCDEAGGYPKPYTVAASHHHGLRVAPGDLGCSLAEYTGTRSNIILRHKQISKPQTLNPKP